MPATKTKPVEKTYRELEPGQVRIAEVYAPSQDVVDYRESMHSSEKEFTNLNGYRLGVKFVDGHAQMPQPIAEDYPDVESFKLDHEGWESRVRLFKEEYGYEVKFAIVNAKTEYEDSEEEV